MGVRLLRVATGRVPVRVLVRVTGRMCENVRESLRVRESDWKRARESARESDFWESEFT